MKPRYKFYYWHSHALQSYEIHNICPTVPAALGMGGASMTSPILIVQEMPRNKSNDKENEK